MDANIVMSQFTASAVVVYAMQKLKTSPWFPLLEEGRAWVSRGVSIGAAFFIHGGIDYTWNPVLNADGKRVLTIAIPTFTAIAVYLYHWLGQYALQESLYQATLNKPSLTTDATGSAPARVSPQGQMVVPVPKDK